jgi:DNA-binding NarL/FixJ family response regulator
MASAATSLARIKGTTQPLERTNKLRGEWQNHELSAREIQIVTGVASGLCSKEIAVLLNLSVATVETHRSNIMRKLKVSSQVFLAHYALRWGLVENAFEPEEYHGA